VIAIVTSGCGSLNAGSYSALARSAYSARRWWPSSRASAATSSRSSVIWASVRHLALGALRLQERDHVLEARREAIVAIAHRAGSRE
jgi:hypothetical protein